MKKKPASAPLKVSDIKLRKLSLGDLLTLERLGIKLIDANTLEMPPLSVTALLTVVYLLAHSSEEIRALRGVPRGIESAVEAFADGIDPDQFEELAVKFKAAVEDSISEAKGKPPAGGAAVS
jgi:hypothetical protein